MPPPEHDIDDGGILNQHRQDNFVSLADVRSRICDPRPGSGELRCRLTDDIENRQLMTAALNAVRHSLPHAAQTDETDLHFSIPLKWDMGIAPMFPTLRRSPAVYRFRALTLPLRIILPVLPSRPTRKERCNVEYSPIAFYPRLRRFSSAWRSMAYTDVAYKLIAFAMLTPATTWLLYLAAVRNIRPGHDL